MSLQAKIEAVIYASEEPVTLPQLISLLSVEAQAEIDTEEARQGSLLPLDGDAANVASTGNGEGSPSEEPAVGETQPREGASDVPASLSPSEESATASEAESKRDTRERERRLRDHFRAILDRLMAEYAESDRGLEIREVAGGFRFATKPEFHDTVRGFVRSLKPPLKLSLQALETLAVVAYKQPVTAPEVSEIRGVDSGGVLGSLIARKLITTAGRKQVIGRPILYKTTKEFLLRFGLKDVGELPSIEEFERMAGELAEAVQEEIEMEQDTAPHRSEETVGDTDASEPALDGDAQDVRRAEDVEPMRDVHEAQADGVPESDAAADIHTTRHDADEAPKE